ncbi:MAG: hypothetical protein AAFV74_12740 [Pseudomonadota bacterium]
MRKDSAQKNRSSIGRLLSFCETENDFWPNARHFFEVGEEGLAFEGIYIYLLSRDDLWKEHHSLIKAIRDSLADFIDFDELELSVVDDGRYSGGKATLEWRQAIVRELNGGELTGKTS